MYFPLTCLSHGSILNSPSRVDAVCKFAKERSGALAGLPLTDLDNISQSATYYKEMKKLELKPILGVQLTVCRDISSNHRAENVNDGRLILLCKNLQAWQELLRIIYYINNIDRFHHRPRLSPSELQTFDLTHFIGISNGTGLANIRALKAAIPTFYEGINPIAQFKSQLQEDKYIVPITYNGCLEKSNLNMLSILRKKENKKNTIDPKSYILSEDELRKYGFEDCHFKRTLDIFSQIEEFDITHPPALPSYPDTKDETQYIHEACENNLRALGLSDNHIQQMEHELNVIKSANMEGYFLIMADIMQFLKRSGKIVGTARGSAAGCLISYLLGITKVDPLQYDLMFERFYNADRKGLPDIDVDIPPESRPILCEYIRERYGEKNFYQLATFGTLKGANALKLCLTNSINNVSFFEQNAITQQLPKEGKVAPELEDQKKQFGSESTILWALRNTPKQLEEWCILTKDGKYDGKYAEEFELAIQLDKIICSRGKHASAFALSDTPIYQKAPVIYDEISGENIVGVEMDSSANFGLVKLDLLGLDLLSKAEYIQEVLKNGSICKTKYW